jgi:hypothetical protein
VIDDLIELVLRRELSTQGRDDQVARPPYAASSLAFTRASARRCWRVAGGSCDGSFELLREPWRVCSSSLPTRSSSRALATINCSSACTSSR